MVKAIVGREYADFLIEQVRNAKRSVKVLVYDWRWYSHDIGSKIQQFNYVLQEVSRNGVDVEVLVNTDFVSTHFAGTRVKVKKVETKKIMHAKRVIIDEKIACAGSHNFTKNAFDLNHEITIATDDEETVSRLLKFFEALS